MGQIDDRLKELGIEIPEVTAPVANYVGYVQTGNLVFTSGQLPFVDGDLKYKGVVGKDVSVEDATAAAKLCAINIIAQVKAACGGDLDRVVRCLKLVGFVNGVPEFEGHPVVINGASDLMVDVFGDKGKHARAAVGAGSLPLNTSVEIESIFEID